MSNFEFFTIVTDMKRKYGISDEDTNRILISFTNATASANASTNVPIPEPVKPVENKTVIKQPTAKKTTSNMKQTRISSGPCRAILKLGPRKDEECGQPSMVANEDGTPFEAGKEVCSRHKTYFLNNSSSVKTVGNKAPNASKMTKLSDASSNMFTNMVDMSTLDKNDQYVGSTALTDPVKNRLGLLAIPGYNEYSEDVTKLVFRYVEGSDVPVCFARIPDLDHKDQILPLDAKSISICQAKIIKYEEDPNPQLTRKSFNSVPFNGADPVPSIAPIASVSDMRNSFGSVPPMPSFGNFESNRGSILPSRTTPGEQRGSILPNRSSPNPNSVVPNRTSLIRSQADSVLPNRSSPVSSSGRSSILPGRISASNGFDPQPIGNQSLTSQFGSLTFGENPFGADMSSLARASVQYGAVRMSPAANQFQQP